MTTQIEQRNGPDRRELAGNLEAGELDRVQPRAVQNPLEHARHVKVQAFGVALQ